MIGDLGCVMTGNFKEGMKNAHFVKIENRIHQCCMLLIASIFSLSMLSHHIPSIEVEIAEKEKNKDETFKCFVMVKVLTIIILYFLYDLL